MTKHCIALAAWTFVLLIVSQTSYAQKPWPQESIFTSSLEFTDDKASRVTLSRFAGKPTIMSMIYTSCKSSCPLMISKLIKLRDAIAKNKLQANFVLVSFDTKNETSETLANLRKTHRLDSPNWFLFLGDAANVRELSVLLGISYRREGDGEIVHSNRIVLLDSNGVIRKTFDGLADDTPLIIDTMKSLNE